MDAKTHKKLLDRAMAVERMIELLLVEPDMPNVPPEITQQIFALKHTSMLLSLLVKSTEPEPARAIEYLRGEALYPHGSRVP